MSLKIPRCFKSIPINCGFLNTFCCKFCNLFITLLAESDVQVCAKTRYRRISIHTLLASIPINCGFLNTFCCKFCNLFITLLAESDVQVCAKTRYRRISIHTLLAESDPFPCIWIIRGAISIHTLLAKSDNVSTAFFRPPSLFQSTLSSRRVTRRLVPLS